MVADRTVTVKTIKKEMAFALIVSIRTIILPVYKQNTSVLYLWKFRYSNNIILLKLLHALF